MLPNDANLIVATFVLTLTKHTQRLPTGAESSNIYFKVIVFQTLAHNLIIFINHERLV